MKKAVENIIKDLNFDETGSIKKNDKYGIYFLIGKIKGRDVFLKIINKKHKNNAERFEKEILVDHIIDKHNKDLQKPLVVKTDILGSGATAKYKWIARKYYPGKSLASYNPEKLLFGYDLIKSNFQLERKRIIDGIIDNIEAIYSFETDLRKLAIRKKNFPHRFPDEINFSQLSKKTGINFEKHQQLFIKNKDKYFDKINTRAAVNDLHPANIISKDDGQLVFADLEHFSFDNYTIDIAFLWLFLWRYKLWQTNLLEPTIKNEEDRVFFCISLIRILSVLYLMPYNTNHDTKKPDLKHYLKSNKWVKYFIAAGESFEAIMKVK